MTGATPLCEPCGNWSSRRRSSRADLFDDGFRLEARGLEGGPRVANISKHQLSVLPGVLAGCDRPSEMPASPTGRVKAGVLREYPEQGSNTYVQGASMCSMTYGLHPLSPLGHWAATRRQRPALAVIH
jgi:hypothetical protein